MIMNKGGIGHIEIILAFILFLTFVLFAVYLFNPITKSSANDLSAERVFNSIIENISVDVVEYSIIPDSSLGGDLNVTFDASIGNNYALLGARVESYNGTLLKLNKIGNSLYIKGNQENFLSLRLSDDITTTNYDSNLINGVNKFRMASSISRKMASEVKLQVVNRTYFSNYNKLKAILGVPVNNDFSIELSFDDGSRVNMNRNARNGQIFVHEERIRVLRLDGSYNFANIRVKIW